MYLKKSFQFFPNYLLSYLFQIYVRQIANRFLIRCRFYLSSYPFRLAASYKLRFL